MIMNESAGRLVDNIERLVEKPLTKDRAAELRNLLQESSDLLREMADLHERKQNANNVDVWRFS